jgi:hypothetical protein
MKLERERDIPAFKGKSWRERIALRNQAKERDSWIVPLQLLVYFLCVVPPFALPAWLGFRISSLALFIIYMVVSLPIYMLFYALFITPRIRRALESDAKPSA